MTLHRIKILINVILSKIILGCSKNNDILSEELIDNNIKFSIGGIEEMEELEYLSTGKQQASLNYLKGTLENNLPDICEFKNYNGFDAFMSVPNETIINKFQIKQAKIKSGKLLAATQPIRSEIHYKILLYHNNGAYIGKIDGICSQATADSKRLRIIKGQTYKWYAYSLNNDQSLADPDMTNPSEPFLPKSIIENKDLLFATGSFVAQPINISEQSVDNKVNISFKHKTKKLTIKFDTKGMFGNIKNLDITLPTDNKFYAGDFNVLNGTFRNLSKMSEISADISNFLPLTEGYVKSFSIYLHNQESESNIAPIQIQLNGGFKLSTDEVGVDRTFPENVDLQFNQTINMNTEGVNYTARIIFVESAIKVGPNDQGTCNGTNCFYRVARANLYYDAQSGEYKFRSNPRKIYSADIDNELWNFGVSKPRDIILETGGNFTLDFVDPCTLVYPNGVWTNGTNLDVYGSSSTPYTDWFKNNSHTNSIGPNYLLRRRVIGTLANINTTAAYGYTDDELYLALIGYRESNNGNYGLGSNSYTIYSSGASNKVTNAESSGSYYKRYVNTLQFFGNDIYMSPDLGDHIREGNAIRCMRSIGY